MQDHEKFSIEFQQHILNWYDKNGRSLPWRVRPEDRLKGIENNPYAVWLSEIMLQQTTVATVKEYFIRFLKKWPTVHALGAADRDDVLKEWAGLGYYARARNLHKCAQIVSALGHFPSDQTELLKLPGIGPYTSAAIAAIAFDKPAVVMDGNIERVMARIFNVTEPLPASKPILYGHAGDMTPKIRPGDYAQALMDLGATICTPRSPACCICPVMKMCNAKDAGTAPELPAKLPKKKKPIRKGVAYITQNSDGDIWLIKRQDQGLLGGMTALPSSEWIDIEDKKEPSNAMPCEANWISIGEVRHTFTHFHLILDVHYAHAENIDADGYWCKQDNVLNEALPTVMRKAYNLLT